MICLNKDGKTYSTDIIYDDSCNWSAERLLKEAKDGQSFMDDNMNPYNGCDNWRMSNIEKNTKLYVLVADPNLKNILDGKLELFDYFFDEKTLKEYINKDGSFDSTELSRAVQVNPFVNLEDNVPVYRNNIICYDVKNCFQSPTAICEANNQFGSGGAHQAFIPKDRLKEMLENNQIALNLQASYINKGYNCILSDEEFDAIKAIRDSRIAYCKNQKCRHPEGKIVSYGFTLVNPIEGNFGNAETDRIIVQTSSIKSEEPFLFEGEIHERKKTVLDVIKERDSIKVTTNSKKEFVKDYKNLKNNITYTSENDDILEYG